MIRKKFYFLLISVCCMIFSCQTWSQVATKSSLPLPAENLAQLLEKSNPHWFEDVRESLKIRFEKQPSAQGSDQERQLYDFYKSRDFQPAWLVRSGWGPALPKAFEILIRAHEEGLNPADYTWAIDAIQKTKQNVADLVRAEIQFSTALLQYIDDMGGERFNPGKIGKSLYLKAVNVKAAQILAQGLASDQTGAFLQQITFHNEQYQGLKKLLAQYRQKVGKGDDMPRLGQEITLKKGMNHDQVLVLRTLLIGHDVMPDTNNVSSQFDQPLQDAVKNFQERSGLEVDGVVGAQTRKALNRTIRDKIDQILVTMERWRWLPETIHDRYVFVNIAGFELFAYDQGKVVFHTPVIIGKNYRKTPVFTSKITSIRFNPPWDVPRSIAVKDKLSKLQQDPSYLSKKGFQVYDLEGNPISPDSINWSEITPSTFTYHLRQRPGSANALGKIRFTIDNPFDVYLHSTPDQYLFDKKVRNFSSGCIRVKDPDQLAVFVLNDLAKWPLQVVSAAMEGSQTREVHLKNPVPVYITYFTVWINKDGTARFMEDIYGQDQEILHAIRHRHAFDKKS